MTTKSTNEAPLTATGRVPGPKGMETRRRLLDEVEKRCVRSHYGAITVAEIAQAANVSSASFYHYFPDVTAAAAEVATAHLSHFDEVLALARRTVEQSGEIDTCRDFVQAFFDFWEDRPGLIEAIVLASRDEDPRFFRVLLRALVSLTEALGRGVHSADPTGVAGSLVMMLSHGAARRDGFERDGVPPHALIESQAVILNRTLSA